MIVQEGFADRARRALMRFDAARGRRTNQEELAALTSKAAGVRITQQTMQKWLSGATSPRTFAKIQALASVLQVPASWLAFGDGSGAATPGVAGSAASYPAAVDKPPDREIAMPEAPAPTRKRRRRAG